uniref:Putative misexpression suppressor of ras 3 n=1 Tax=Corethrella appendiculata TaxID=1370023 RepID=U5ES45_9DIPT
MAHMHRRRLGSVSDNSAPSSDISEGSEICEQVPDWSLDGEPQSLPQLFQQTLSIGSGSQHSNSLYINDDVELRSHDTISLDNSGIITEYERSQIESFFSGLGTEVFVSSSLANLYESVGKENWRLVYTGIPVLLHDKGCTRSRCTPRVTFVLAERGTCFALWKDTIDNLSDYKVAAAAFHTMCLSSDHRKLIGFSFDSNQAAREIWMCVEKLISNPENIALSMPGRKRKQQQKRNKNIVLPPKSQISHPCQFHHVTSVTRNDTQRFFSLQAFVTPPNKHRDP